MTKTPIHRGSGYGKHDFSLSLFWIRAKPNEYIYKIDNQSMLAEVSVLGEGKKKK
jgi:hypothetical protein